MLTDRYGLSVSTSSQAARDAYVVGVDCLLAATAGYREHLGRAIEADPALREASSSTPTWRRRAWRRRGRASSPRA
jgi:hypothetical protein